VTLHEPFRTLALSNSASATKPEKEANSQAEFEKWLPGMDSNHDLDRFFRFFNLLILQGR
jgi:hypothetical protein